MCCKDCTKRTLGCHSKCEEYLAEKAKRQELNDKRRKEKDSINDFKEVRKYVVRTKKR